MRRSVSKGTPDQMIDAFESRISELNGLDASEELGDIDEVDAITAAYRDDVIDDDVLCSVNNTQLDDYYKEEVDEYVQAADNYIQAVVAEVDSQLGEFGQFESWTWDQNATEDTLILTTVVGQQVHEYSIPLDDLSQSFDGIDTDVEYIMSAVLQGGGAADEGLAEDSIGVESATTVQGGLFEFGAEKAEQYGDLICEHLAGKTVSKRRDLANEPGGLIYEANELGIDMWDLLEALEGLCRQRRCTEIDDSTYKILGCGVDNGIEDEDVLVEGSSDYVEPSGPVYVLRHGWGPGTLPKGVNVISHWEEDEMDYVELDRELTEKELDYYDIEPINSADGEWIELESKSVPDSDGSLTDYTLYSNQDSTMFICMFGDKEIYTPDIDYADFETENEEEAYDWYYSYNGFEDEDIYSATEN